MMQSLKKTGSAGLLLLIVFAACRQTSKSPAAETEKTHWQLAPEYAPAKSVWLLWPNTEHKKGLSNSAVTLELIRQILPHAGVNLVCANDSTAGAVRSILGDEILQQTDFQIHTLPFQEFWARDMGPIFVSDKQGKRAIADFNFNVWDYGDTTDALVRRDEKLDENVARLRGLPLVSSDMIHESGDHEINGQGVLMVVEAVEKQRNPNMSMTQMEAEFARLLGAKKVIWLREGLIEDESTFDGPIRSKNSEAIYTLLTTNGHIDEFARFVNDSTILMAEVAPEDLAKGDPIALENARRLEVNFHILKSATTLAGKPFHIERIPLPRTILTDLNPGDPVYDMISEMQFDDGSVFPKGKTVQGIAAASYCNFLIVNDLIIAPKYARPDSDVKTQVRDEWAKAVLQKIFPGKKIVMIDALSINFGGGGIHCITMQEG